MAIIVIVVVVININIVHNVIVIFVPINIIIDAVWYVDLSMREGAWGTYIYVGAAFFPS